MEKQVDVLVVGAGPVGLLTAIELTLSGVGVLVLERLAEPSMVMKAGGIGPLGCETLMRRGMAAAMDAAEALNLAAMQQAGAQARGKGSKSSGHFAGLPIPKDAQKEPERRFHMVDQQGLEAILANRVESLGIEVRRECEVIGFTQQADGVDVMWTSPTGQDHIRCAYLIGCDGGRSSIRKMAGFDFPGTDPTSTLYQVLAEVDHPERLPPVGWHRTSGGVFSYGPMPGRLFMLDFVGVPDDRQAPVTRKETEEVLRRVSGADVRVKSLESAADGRTTRGLWTPTAETGCCLPVTRRTSIRRLVVRASAWDWSTPQISAGSSRRSFAGMRPRACSTPTRPSGGPSPRPSWRTPSPSWPSCGPMRNQEPCGTSWPTSCNSMTSPGSSAE